MKCVSEELHLLKISRESFQEYCLAHKIQFPAKQNVAKQPHAVFADANKMKAKLRKQLARPPYDVRNYYKDKGIAQKIARSALFDNLTLAVIAFNAVWISIDTDNNNAEILVEASPVFIVVENCFCAYFTGEWVFRYLSFRRKQDGLRDSWFVFDTVLVFMMVLETWVMNAIVLMFGGGGSGAVGNASVLRIFKLARLTKMARMARLLRAMPELVVLIKGMAIAMRSVFFTFTLLTGIMYIFAIAFVQLMKGTDAGLLYFPDVPSAMNSLLLDAVMPDEAAIIEGVGADGWIFKVMLLVYILLASLTVLNLLVGVLCEVVSVVSSVEKETLLVNYVKGTLLEMLQREGLDADGDQMISRVEFEALLENPAASKALTDVGVDVIGLIDFTDFIFKDGKQLSFPDFMEVVLQLRGSNVATVKDLVDLRKIVISELDKISKSQAEVSEKLLSGYVQGQLSHSQTSLTSPSNPRWASAATAADNAVVFATEGPHEDSESV